MATDRIKRLIGSGADFPIKLTPALDTNGNQMITPEGEPMMGWHILEGDVQLIQQSLKNIIYTLLGQRIRQEGFGCRVHEVLEEPNNRVIQHLTSKFVTESILQWEPRLSFVKVESVSEFNKIEMEIHYKLANATDGEHIYSLTYNI